MTPAARDGRDAPAGLDVPPAWATPAGSTTMGPARLDDPAPVPMATAGFDDPPRIDEPLLASMAMTRPALDDPATAR